MTNKIANSNFKLFIVDRIYNTSDKQFYTVESYSDKNLYIAKENNIYRTKYNSCSVFLSAFEININTPFEVEYTLYAKNDVDELIFLEKILAEDGSHRFTHLKKKQKYVIRAEDTLGKYISKAVDYISSGPTEDDEIDMQIIDFKNNPQLGLIFKAHNLLGDKEINLENHPSFLKVKSLGNDFYQVYVDGSPKQAYEFDIDITDNRPSSTVKFTRHFVINDGYSKPLNVSIEFLDNGSAIIRWSGDGTIDYYKLYFDNQPLKNHKLPDAVGNTGLTTFIINDYPLSETRYLKISSLRHNIEKFCDEIIIEGIEAHSLNNDFMIFATYGSPIKDSSTNNRTITLNGAPTIVNTKPGYKDTGSLYLNGAQGLNIKIPELGTSDFTFEYYFSLSSYAGTPRMFEFTENTGYNQLCGVFYNNTNAPYLAYKNNNVWADYGKNIKTININEWHHYCLMRKNNIIYYFIDGILLTTITDTYPLLTTDLYIGQSYANSSYIDGYYNSIRLTRNIARYNEQGFNVNSINIALLNKITKPDNIRYSIKDNNDLQIDIIHENNNVDNYSVYLEENEITSIDGLKPIVTSTSKNIVIPNFDVYNNYDRTLKLLATTNKYNHSYLSENKDLYAAYDWTPEEILSIRSWLISDNKDNILTNEKLSLIKDKSGNNANAVPYSNDLNNSAEIIKNELNNRDVWKCSPSGYKGIFNIYDKTISNNVGGITLCIVSKSTHSIGSEGTYLIRIDVGSNQSVRAMIGRGYYGNNIVYGGGRRLDNDNFFEIHENTDYGTDWIIAIYSIDYINSKAILSINGRVIEKDATFNGGNSQATDTLNISIGHWGGGIGDTAGYGYYAESIILDSAINTDQRINLEGYLANQWGLTDNLPSDHPYKTKRPIIDHTPYNLIAEFKND